MRTHKDNCISHVIAAFEERFTEKDFTTKSKKWGEVSWKEEVVSAIANAPFKITVMDTKPVFVVWDIFLDCAVTVLTGEMWNKSKDW